MNPLILFATKALKFSFDPSVAEVVRTVSKQEGSVRIES